ncbi:sulfotransferase family protein [Acidocella aquatica]|uniref:sulfotransferase family protein n=1 Tax=Acidocella aquatica TaxID=1922313 RepID=UPI0024E1338D|nr:sulfotransferase [Acidocella aquatica]
MEDEKMSNHDDHEILDEQRAMDRAEASTGLHDWGNDLSFKTGLKILIQSVEEMHPSPEFRDTVSKRIQRILETRLHLVDDAKQHPEIEQQKIERPIAIIGLPRTGTTITYDLITLDPAVRAPREFEMLLPWPASDAATFATDPRIAIIQAMNDNYLKHAPQLKEIQRLDCTLAGECNHGMTYHFAGSNFPAEFGVPRFAKWVTDEIPEGLYRTHKRLLQEFQWKGPKGRWVIKSPHHLFDLGGLTKAYPDIGMIWTHRDPVATMSSLSSMIAALQAAVGQGGDLHAVGRSVVDMWCTAMARATRVRAENPAIETKILDLAHRDIVLDPIGSIRRIYARFDQPFTVDFEARIRTFLTENPSATRLGKHKHTPSQFGIDPEEVHTRLAGYYERFGSFLQKP